MASNRLSMLGPASESRIRGVPIGSKRTGAISLASVFAMAVQVEDSWRLSPVLRSKTGRRPRRVPSRP